MLLCCFADQLQQSCIWKPKLLRLLQQIQKMLLQPAPVQASSTCRCSKVKLRYSNNAQKSMIQAVLFLTHQTTHQRLLSPDEPHLAAYWHTLPLCLTQHRCIIKMLADDANLHVRCILSQPYTHVKSPFSLLLLQEGTQYLSQLLHKVAMSHMHHAKALLVGYTMKPSRERNLASRGLLPLTAPHDLCFVPIDFALPLEQQGPFDILLHKVQHLRHCSTQPKR